MNIFFHFHAFSPAYIYIYFFFPLFFSITTNIATGHLASWVGSKRRSENSWKRDVAERWQSRSRSRGQGTGRKKEQEGGGGDNGTERRCREQRVLIDTAVLIHGNSFYFIRFFFRLLRERSSKTEAAPPPYPSPS